MSNMSADSAEEFLKKLREAYSRVAEANPNDPAPIISVLTELSYLLQSPQFRQDPRRENFRSYSRADFSHDVYNTRQLKVLNLTVATRAHTKRRMDFLWIPDDESGRGTTYSHLHFRETTQ